MSITRTATAILALALTGCAHAQVTEATDLLTACETVSALAEKVMEGRQGGLPMSAAMRAVSSSGDLGRSMVIRAYEWPRGSSQAAQWRAVSEYRDMWYASCINVLMPT